MKQFLWVERGGGARHARRGVGGERLTSRVVAPRRAGWWCTPPFDNETFWQLVDRLGSQSEVMIFAGGQAGNYPARHVVSIDAAVRAATTSFETGALNPDQAWHKQ